MTTKDYCLSFKDKQDIFVDNKSDSQYDNLNLNQNHQFEKTLCPKSVTRDDRKVENY
uniref:Uncharacterized protein n=1 Tax=Panagrolaimus sp. ES5 TaxID=591445 RepID=A0AC34G6Q7_9BILA